MLNLKSPTLKFSVSGMRGIIPKDLNTQNLPFIISAFEKSLPGGKIAIARDTRESGEFIEKLALGILSGLGREVYALGITPTPTIKAYIKSHKLAGGLMISASHNPPEYNAFKFIGKDGFFFSEKENNFFLENLNKIEQKSDYTTSKKYHPGRIQDKTYYPEHEASLEHIDSVIQSILPNGTNKKLKIAIDPVSAAASKTAPLLLEKLNISFYSIHSEFYPHFPRKPEPIPSALKKLGKLVLENKCDIGFAFDPDGDRLALVGPDGKPLGEEYTLILAMNEYYQKNSGPAVINLSTSWINEYIAQKYEQKIYRSKVGEANVVSLMRLKKARFGGEGNGGVIDAKVPSFGRDSITAMAYILSSLNREPLHETLKKLPQTYMQKTTIKINEDLDSENVIKKIIASLSKAYPDYEMDTSDGFRLSSPIGIPWIHIRSSNTEPLIRIIWEAKTKKEIKKIISVIENKS